WMLHGGPIIRPVNFSEQEAAEVQRMQSRLSFAALDATLREFEKGAPPAVAASSGLELPIVERIYRVAKAATEIKIIPQGISLLGVETCPCKLWLGFYKPQLPKLPQPSLCFPQTNASLMRMRRAK